jgi:hypothetical protein
MTPQHDDPIYIRFKEKFLPLTSETRHERQLRELRMPYTVHCSIITNENHQNAQMIYIFSICTTYMFRSCLTIIRVRCHRVRNTMTCAFVQGVIVYKYILHNPNIV